MAQIDRIPKNLIQYGLNALGFPVDEVSGVIDSSTHRAIREYQSSIGESQTGDLTAQQTVDLLLAAAATGDPHAQNAVGYMVAKGVGLTIDYDAARGWLGKAAKQDDPYALMNLALLYRDGLGVPKDVPQARQLLARAKDRGLSDAGSMLREIEAR
jgi:TPR repeat protein